MSGNGGQLGHRAEGIYQNLRRELIQGAYSTDSRLPSIERLARKHKVTAVTLRKAALRLADEGMLDIRHGSGMFVRKTVGENPMSKTISVMYMYDGENLNMIQREIMGRGFQMNVYSQIFNKWDPHAEKMFLQRVKEEKHQALIAFCSPNKPGNEDLLSEIEYNGTRVIHVEHYKPGLPSQNYILPDFYRAGHMAVTSLLIAGYSPIYMLYHTDSLKTMIPFASLVFDGVKAACEEHFGEFDAEKMSLDMPTHVDFKRKIKKVVESIPDGAGVVSFTGGHGFHLLKELRRQQRAVPEKVGVLSIEVAGELGGQEHRTDILSFGRDKKIMKAIDVATDPDFKKLRELIPPVHVRNGTVRRKG